MITYRQPFRGEYPITQYYGEVIPGVTYQGKPHTGIDYGCPSGTEILASADGIVMRAGWDSTGYGNCIIILHEAKKATLYAHLSKCSVWLNQKVQQGDVIGLSGATGNTTGPHLHFEARKVWNNYTTHQDPVTYLPLMSVEDFSHTEQKSLKDAEDFQEGTTLSIVAPAGAKAFDVKFDKYSVLGPGTKVTYTGEVVERNGYQYMRCYMPFYIAVNDHETQILDRVV